jgi:hypothetical protein
MQFTESINAAATIAKSKTASRAVHAAIERALTGLRGAWVVTELANCLANTSDSGATYFASAHTCQCPAFHSGQICKHRCAARLVTIARELETAPAAVPVRVPRITRSIERDVVTGARVRVTYCDNWAI